MTQSTMVGGGKDYGGCLLSNVHEGLELPEGARQVMTVRGDYLYYHYGCDGFDDRGWGCGYRTLMTACSWVRGQLEGIRQGPQLPLVPTNKRIQEILVDIGDKESSFVGSRQWIGSLEVSYVLDTLFDIPSKILHLEKGENLKAQLATLEEHFRSKGAPIMMGGESDVSSKGIMGVCRGGKKNEGKEDEEEEAYLLVVDPHFWGRAVEAKPLQASGWVKWQPLSDFHQSTFYNLCLPQLAATKS